MKLRHVHYIFPNRNLFKIRLCRKNVFKILEFEIMCIIVLDSSTQNSNIRSIYKVAFEIFAVLNSSEFGYLRT